MKKSFLYLILLISLTLAGCTTKINVKLNKDNSVDIQFSAGAGDAFTSMVMSTTGNDGAVDEKQVTYELVKAGFDNVKVKVSGKSNVNISLTDKKHTSYLFTSGMLSVEKGELGLELTRKTLKEYYDSADEQTLTVLDLFLAPVFNDEEMSEEEYLEMVGTFYGEKAAVEIRNSMVDVSFENAKGEKSDFRIPLAGLLSGNNSIIFK